MLSCVNDTRKVVQAMRLGAIDYLTKPFQKAELDAVIGQCVGTAKAESYAGDVEELCDDVFFVAASPAMKKIRAQAALVANVDIPVLLLGESGTGKEVLARLIHKLSPRAHRRAVHFEESAVRARRQFVDQACQHFLAGIAFPQQKDRDVDVRDERGLRTNLLHRRAGS